MASFKQQNKQVTLESFESNDSCVVCGSFAYILMLTSIFGMAPLRFRSHEKGYRISVSKPMCIYSHILVFTLGTYICMAGSLALFGKVVQISMDIDTKTPGSGKLTQMLYLYFHFAITLSAVTGVMGGPKRMKNFIRHLNKIATVDISFGTQYSRLKDFKMFTVVMFMFTLLSILIVHSTYMLRGSGWFQIFLKSILHALTYLEMNLYVQLIYFFMTIRSRFQSINETLTLISYQRSAELKNYVSEPVNECVICEDHTAMDRAIISRKSIPDYPSLVVSPNVAMQRIAILRGALCDILNSVNEDCGVPVVITILSTLGNLVVPLYFMSFVLTKPGLLEKAVGVLINCLWFTMHISVMLFLINPCHNTIQEDKKTRRILCRMLRLAPQSATLLSLLEMFGYQVMLKPASCEPLNMVTLNRLLMITILGAASTYLVILVQI